MKDIFVLILFVVTKILFTALFGVSIVAIYSHIKTGFEGMTILEPILYAAASCIVLWISVISAREIYFPRKRKPNTAR